MYVRVGFGTDLHRTRQGDGLRLGGVFIPCGLSCEAVSDGDVLLHALVDALMGAAGMGDIGDRYPESKVTKGEDSSRFVNEVVADIKAMDANLLNVDCVIDLEAPKLGEWKAEIRKSLAAMLKLDSNRVNIKAKTAEGLGPVGSGEAVTAQVAVLLELAK